MKINSEILISNLFSDTRNNIDFVENLKLLSDQELNKRLHQNSWSILECIQHLNMYSDFYHVEIDSKMKKSRISPSEYFESGLIGNYFVDSMCLDKSSKKMKTPQKMNPIFMNLNRDILDNFIKSQYNLIELLEIAKSKNLSKIKTNISLTKLIKIRLGDTFRFIINHNVRHINQVKRILITKVHEEIANS